MLMQVPSNVVAVEILNARGIAMYTSSSFKLGVALTVQEVSRLVEIDISGEVANEGAY